jgi:hypothetical protein
MIPTRLMQIIAQQTKMIFGLVMQLVQMLLKLWGSFDDWYDDDKVTAVAARSATIVESALRNARVRERAYLRQVYKQADIEFPQENDFRAIIEGGVEIEYPRLGVDALEVWERPAREMRYRMSESGGSLRQSQAMAKVFERIKAMAETDLALARRAEDKFIFEQSKDVLGYHRVIHPELSETGQSCGLCVVASQRLYHKSELMPIHDECNCTVMPAIKGQEPMGPVLNEEDLERLYDAAGGNAAEDLLKTKVSFTEHGELGPIIRSGEGKSDRFERDENFSPIENQVKKMRGALERLATRQQKGEDVAQEIGYLRERIDILERQKSIIESFRRTPR